MPRLYCLSLLLLTILPGPARTARAADTDSTPPVTFEQTLPSGLRIICRREPGPPLVSMQVFVKVGAAQEDPARPGLSNFVARTLFSGLTDETPEIEATEIGGLGGNISATWQADYTQVSALTLPDQFTAAAFLVTNALKKADFDSDAVENTRQDILSDIGDTNASIFQATYKGIRQTLYAGGGYTLPQSGTISSLNGITRNDLQRFYARYYIPRNFVFVVVGDIDPQAAAAKIVEDMKYFDDDRDTLHIPVRTSTSTLADAPSPLPYLAADPVPVHQMQPDLAEVGVMVGYRVPPVSSPDYPAVLVANALLGGMKTSRMFTNLREKQGLSYELGSLVNTQMAAADLTAYAFAAPMRTDTATKKTVSAIGFIKQQILRQVASLQNDPPTALELTRAKHYLVGSYKLRHERLEDRATLLGLAALQSPDGTRFDTDFARYIDAVTAEDLQRVTAKYLVHPAVSVIEPDGKNDGILLE